MNYFTFGKFRYQRLTIVYFKAFHCVFKFDEEKAELPDFWPENVTVSRFYLNEAARDWLNKVDQKWPLVISPLRQRSTKQKSTELNICLHNVRSIRNKTKDVNALLEVNEISLGVFIESWITNNSDDDFILKQCCPPGFFPIVHQGWIKEEVDFASFTDMISIWKILKSLPLNFLNAVMPL